MKHMLYYLLSGLLLTYASASYSTNRTNKDPEAQQRAVTTLNSLYLNYSAPKTCLLRETYPFDSKHAATYLASEEQAGKRNAYSYLWPYSGTFSAVSALFEATKQVRYKMLLDMKVLPGLEEYFDQKRSPAGYASYINEAPESDRFYDDNVWLGIDFTDTYMLTKDSKYLKKAELIWTFVMSGTDDKLGGGIYWCEQKKHSKNTCSNAPGSVFALKMFEATGDSAYFKQGKALYEWTKKNLQDPTDYLYFDNIGLKGNIGKAKYTYNSGQMMQSAALLYRLTKNEMYLTDAQNIAKACHNYFFTDFVPATGNGFKLLKKGDIWFAAVMLRGFIELYRLDNNKMYINTVNDNLNYAWVNARDNKGLFHVDLSGKVKDDKKWLLTQAAMVEMYARLAAVR